MSILLVVTGASRGLGRAFSNSFFKVFMQQQEERPTFSSMHAILISRSIDYMSITKLIMEEQFNKHNKNDNVPQCTELLTQV